MVGLLVAIELGTLGLALLAQRSEESEPKEEPERLSGVCPCVYAGLDTSEVVSVDPGIVAGGHLAPAVILDIRSARDFARGHVEGAVNVPESRIRRVIDSGRLDGVWGPPILVICNRGVRSVPVAALLQDEGIGEAVSMAGGMQDWISRGLPVVGS